MIKEFSIGFSRTINLGNYESARVEASVTCVCQEAVGSEKYDYLAEVAAAENELRLLLEQTWKTQYEFTTQRMKK